MQNLRDVGGTTVKKLAGGFRAQHDWQQEVRLEVDLVGFTCATRPCLAMPSMVGHFNVHNVSFIFI